MVFSLSLFVHVAMVITLALIINMAMVTWLYASNNVPTGPNLRRTAEVVRMSAEHELLVTNKRRTAIADACGQKFIPAP
jgi:hypothetical protein